MIRTFTIPGKPLGKQRPRVLRNGITYTPKETVNYETLVKEIYWNKYPTEKLLEGPVRATITAYMPIPKSTSKKKKALMLERKILPTKKPDWDNIGKIVTDALNEIAYYDDKQIISCTVEKYYSDQPKVQVKIEGGV